MSKKIEISQKHIESKIFTLREEQVMLDRDLADMYRVEVKRLNEQVKRNRERFPENFMFQLTKSEWENLKSQFATSSSEHGGRRYLPYAFTEQGVAMLSAVLRSEVAVKVSIQIMNAFVQMRRLIGQEALQQLRLASIENKLAEHDQRFNQLFTALEENQLPRKGIFFDGQVFDAYNFVSDLVRKARNSIVVIDNYVDDSVLTLFRKSNKNVTTVIYTKTHSRQLALDLKKYNSQYPEIKIIKFTAAHDRFLIIDKKELYHLGASLKDLGKKWFAFSRMDSMITDIFYKLPEKGAE